MSFTNNVIIHFGKIAVAENQATKGGAPHHEEQEGLKDLALYGSKMVKAPAGARVPAGFL
jgi:HD-GYP domain-containing protein (c-di-GMP phosphodiesterase class II)